MSSNIEHSDLEIRLQRVDRVYRPGDLVQGYVVVKAKGGWSHQGIKMRVEGSVRLEPSSRRLDSVYGNVKPMDILAEEILIAAPGRVPHGVTDIPFEFPVRGIGGKPLYETYHGVYINTCYFIQVDCERGVLKTSLHREAEFHVEVPTSKKQPTTPVSFAITPESLENVKQSSLKQIPRFRITGRLHRAVCPITEPFTGEVVVEHSETPIKSVDLQLVRVESITHGDSSIREATEIQSIQIGEDEVCRGMAISLHFVFPRLFTCATMISKRFKVEFEVNLIVVFADDYMVTECFQLVLYRPA